MFNLWGVKCGKYLLFKKNLYESCCYQPIDNSVKLVTDINLLKHNNLGINEGDWARLVQNNSELFVYFDGAIPLGMMWGHRGSCYVRGPGVSLIQDYDTIYWFWVFTLPEARGKNVFNKLRNALFSHYYDAKAFTLLVESGNQIMCKIISKIGFVEVKRYLYVKFGTNALLVERCNETSKITFKIFEGNKKKLLII